MGPSVTPPPKRALFSLTVLLFLVILLVTVLYIVVLSITKNIQTAKQTQEAPYKNPFAQTSPTPTVYQNPFVTPTPTYTNPFSTLQGGGEAQKYENPFEKLR